MKYLGIFLIFLQYSTCFSQKSHYKIYPNGFIYPDSLMTPMIKLANEAHADFSNMSIDKVYYSLPQARATLFYLYDESALEAKQDIEAGATPKQLIKKYKKAEVYKQSIVVRELYSKMDSTQEYRYSCLNLNKYIYKNYTEEPYELSKKGSWIYGCDTSYADVITAIYLTSDFEKHPIPKRYNSLIAYSEYILGEDRKDLNYPSPKNSSYLVCDSSRVKHLYNQAIAGIQRKSWPLFINGHIDLREDIRSMKITISCSFFTCDIYNPPLFSFGELAQTKMDLNALFLGKTFGLSSKSNMDSYRYSYLPMIKYISNLDNLKESIHHAIRDEDLDYGNRYRLLEVYLDLIRITETDYSAPDKRQAFDKASNSLPKQLRIKDMNLY